LAKSHKNLSPILELTFSTIFNSWGIFSLLPRRKLERSFSIHFVFSTLKSRGASIQTYTWFLSAFGSILALNIPSITGLRIITKSDIQKIYLSFLLDFSVSTESLMYREIIFQYLAIIFGSLSWLSWDEQLSHVQNLEAKKGLILNATKRDAISAMEAKIGIGFI
jgi:hypothetical protein